MAVADDIFDMTVEDAQDTVNEAILTAVVQNDLEDGALAMILSEVIGTLRAVEKDLADTKRLVNALGLGFTAINRDALLALANGEAPVETRKEEDVRHGIYL
jgi:hypothetical protein